MIDAGVFEGDTVIIQRCDTAENGSIVVALVDENEVTLKRLRRKGASIALEPANKAYEPASSDRIGSRCRAGWSGCCGSIDGGRCASRRGGEMWAEFYHPRPLAAPILRRIQHNRGVEPDRCRAVAAQIDPVDHQRIRAAAVPHRNQGDETAALAAILRQCRRVPDQRNQPARSRCQRQPSASQRKAPASADSPGCGNGAAGTPPAARNHASAAACRISRTTTDSHHSLRGSRPAGRLRRRGCRANRRERARRSQQQRRQSPIAPGCAPDHQPDAAQRRRQKPPDRHRRQIEHGNPAGRRSNAQPARSSSGPSPSARGRSFQSERQQQAGGHGPGHDPEPCERPPRPDSPRSKHGEAVEMINGEASRRERRHQRRQADAERCSTKRPIGPRPWRRSERAGPAVS